MSRLDDIQDEIEQLRRKPANVCHRELRNIAQALGRTRDTTRGKEPTFVNREMRWTPLSIPDHPGALAKGTVHSILDQLEDDLMALREVEEK